MRGGSGRRTRIDAPTTEPSAHSPHPPATRAEKKRVLFVCLGNSCRSQMAEAFARSYGGDILEVRSAGLAPAAIIQPLTRQTLAARNLRIDDQFPKGLDVFTREPFDVVVNLSGQHVPPLGRLQIDWKVDDPIGQKESVYQAVADQIEHLVMRLILQLRSELPAES
jgi:arsenate reductase